MEQHLLGEPVPQEVVEAGVGGVAIVGYPPNESTCVTGGNRHQIINPSLAENSVQASKDYMQRGIFSMGAHKVAMMTDAAVARYERVPSANAAWLDREARLCNKLNELLAGQQLKVILGHHKSKRAAAR